MAILAGLCRDGALHAESSVKGKLFVQKASTNIAIFMQREISRERFFVQMVVSRGTLLQRAIAKMALIVRRTRCGEGAFRLHSFYYTAPKIIEFSSDLMNITSVSFLKSKVRAFDL